MKIVCAIIKKLSADKILFCSTAKTKDHGMKTKLMWSLSGFQNVLVINFLKFQRQTYQVLFQVHKKTEQKQNNSKKKSNKKKV